MQSDDGLVELGQIVVSVHRLSMASGGIEDISLRQAVDLLQTEPFGERVPGHGWRVLEAEQGGSVVTVGAYDTESPGWTTVTFRRDSNGWRPHRSSYGLEPSPTPRSRGLGFRFAFADDVVTMRRGKRPSIRVLLTNTTAQPWEGLTNVGWVLGRLFDLADGHYLDDEPQAFALAGYSLELAPGATEELNVVLLTRGVWHLPIGDYGIAAAIAELGLHVSDGILRIVER
jgi:hypothetical protein